MDIKNYELLGISPDATDAEVQEAYERLKAKYDEEKWLEGEAGNNAAKMLTKLKAAYDEIMSERMEKGGDSGASKLKEVRERIKAGDISGAQDLLDSFNERTAEWHFLQSVVFYKKNWMNESKKQLEIAMQMDPENQQYRSEYAKLNARTQYKEQDAGTQQPRPDPAAEQMGGNWCSTCATMCYTYLCVECLCSMCRCG